MRSNYHEKRASKLVRFTKLASKAHKESEAAFKLSTSMADVIPFGQPILVGHHSEGRDRRYRKRIRDLMGKSVHLDKKAAHYENKVQNLESDHVISSDDPDAIQKLKAKLAGMEKNQEIMKAGNKIIKSKKLNEVEKVDGLVALGLTEKQALEIMQPDFCGRIGFASFNLTNNNANMKRVKDRITQLEKLDQIGETEQVFGDIKLVVSGADNRVKIFFPGKPSEAIRKDLKSNGFRWAPSEGAWMRNVSSWAIRIAKEIINKAII